MRKLVVLLIVLFAVFVLLNAYAGNRSEIREAARQNIYAGVGV